MNKRSLARRYAEALFLSAKEKNILEQVENEFKLAMETIFDNEDLRQIIERKMVSVQVKEEVLEKIFSNKVSPIVLNFLKVVVKKRREDYLQDMLREYSAFADEEGNIAEAKVKSASEITPEQQKLIKERISALTGKEIRLSTEVDPELLGGMIIRVGDKVYDGSARQQLKTLKSNLISVQFEGDRGEKAK